MAILSCKVFKYLNESIIRNLMVLKLIVGEKCMLLPVEAIFKAFPDHFPFLVKKKIT